MSPEKQRELASRGGTAAHAKGSAHEYDSASGTKAGRKGGLSTSKDRKHMAKIGAAGGHARARKAAAEKASQKKTTPEA